jgi:hypothetical protein
VKSCSVLSVDAVCRVIYRLKMEPQRPNFVGGELAGANTVRYLCRRQCALRCLSVSHLFRVELRTEWMDFGRCSEVCRQCRSYVCYLYRRFCLLSLYCVTYGFSSRYRSTVSSLSVSRGSRFVAHFIVAPSSRRTVYSKRTGCRQNGYVIIGNKNMKSTRKEWVFVAERNRL